MTALLSCFPDQPLESLRLDFSYHFDGSVIHEGKKRQVRRMFMSLGRKVLRLKRIRMGKLVMGNLQEGSIKEISPSEIRRLFG